MNKIFYTAAILSAMLMAGFVGAGSYQHCNIYSCTIYVYTTTSTTTSSTSISTMATTITSTSSVPTTSLIMNQTMNTTTIPQQSNSTSQGGNSVQGEAQGGIPCYICELGEFNYKYLDFYNVSSGTVWTAFQNGTIRNTYLGLDSFGNESDT